MPEITKLTAELLTKYDLLSPDNDDAYLQSLNTSVFLKMYALEGKKDPADARYQALNTHLTQLEVLNQQLIKQDSKLERVYGNLHRKENISRKEFMETSAILEVKRNIKNDLATRDALILAIKQEHLKIIRANLERVQDTTSPEFMRLQRELDKLSDSEHPEKLRQENLMFLEQKVFLLNDKKPIAAPQAPINELDALINRVGYIKGLTMQAEQEKKYLRTPSTTDINPHLDDPRLVALYQQKKDIDQQITKQLLELQSVLRSTPKSPPPDKSTIELWQQQVRALETLYNKTKPNLIVSIQKRIHSFNEVDPQALNNARGALHLKLLSLMNDLDTLEAMHFQTHRNEKDNAALKVAKQGLFQQINEVKILLKNKSLGFPPKETKALLSALNNRMNENPIPSVKTKETPLSFNKLFSNMWENTVVRKEDYQKIVKTCLIAETKFSEHDHDTLIKIARLHEQHSSILNEFNAIRVSIQSDIDKLKEQEHIYPEQKKKLDEALEAVNKKEASYKKTASAHFTDNIAQLDNYQKIISKALVLKQQSQTEFSSTLQTELETFPQKLKNLTAKFESTKSELKVKFKRINPQKDYDKIFKELEAPFRKRLESTNKTIKEYEDVQAEVVNEIKNKLNEMEREYKAQQLQLIKEPISKLWQTKSRIPPSTPPNPFHAMLNEQITTYNGLKDELGELPNDIPGFKNWCISANNILNTASDLSEAISHLSSQAASFDKQVNTEVYQSTNAFLTNIKDEIIKIIEAHPESDSKLIKNIKKNPHEYITHMESEGMTKLQKIDPRLDQLVTVYQNFNQSQTDYTSALRTCIASRNPKNDLDMRITNVHAMHKESIERNIAQVIKHKSSLINPPFYKILYENLQKAFGAVKEFFQSFKNDNKNHQVQTQAPSNAYHVDTADLIKKQLGNMEQTRRAKHVVQALKQDASDEPAVVENNRKGPAI